MAFGIVNTPGEWLVTLKKQLKDALDGLTAEDVGASPAGHKHTKSEITDFPASMPASDVSAWAKAATKPTYTASEVGAKATSWKPYHAGTSAPTDTAQLWIDTTASDPKLKYHNGSTWVPVPVAFFVP